MGWRNIVDANLGNSVKAGGASPSPTSKLKEMTEIENEFVENILSYNSEPRRKLEENEDRELYLTEIKRILDQFTEFEYDIQPGGIVIKFPDYICRDSYGNTTPIYSPFAYVRVDRKVNFRRTKYTNLQYSNSYIHSHVSGSSSRNGWASSEQICYGSNIVTQGSFLETLITVLTFYPTFLREESSMTSPHKRIGNLGVGGSIASKPKNIDDYSAFINCLQVKIKNLYGLQLLEVHIKDEEQFNNTLIQAGAYCYKLDGKLYRDLNVSNEAERVLPNDFTFKGENQPLLIVADEVQIPPKSVCELTKADILNKINQHINDPAFFQQS